MVHCFAMTMPLLMVFCSSAYGAATGGQPGQFLSWGAGARSLGMGKAFFSVADDASATYWNPAGMTQLERKEIMALHVNLFADTTYDFLSFVYPTPKHGVFGMNLTRLYSGGFEKIAITYDPTKTDIVSIDTLGTFDDVQMAFTGAYARKIKENMSVGIAGKYVTHTLDTSVSGFITFDTTLLVEGINHRFKDLQLGFGIQNLMSATMGDTDDKLPLIFRFGASHPFLREKMLLSFDIDKNMNANMGWHIGTEYWLVNFAAIRIGFEGGDGGIRETTAGFGVKYKDYGIDYAFAIHDLGMSHRLSGSWRFGPSIVGNRDALVSKYIQESVEAYRQGNYVLAAERIDAALDIEPGNKEAKKMYNRLGLVLGYVQSASGENEEANSIRKGIGGYLEGDSKTAINGLRYAYYKNPGNMKVLGLLNRIEKELGIKATESQRGDVVGFTIIDQKIYDARQAIIEGRYDQALMKCQEVINLEPENVTALEIMGSAFFMMDQPEQAKEIWIKLINKNNTNQNNSRPSK